MVEVVFSDSTKGAMKVAKNYDEKRIGYIGKKPSKAELKKHFEGQAVGGDSQDVVFLGYALDIGDISGEFDGIERQSVFQKIWGRFNFDDNEHEQFFHNQRKDMKKLMSAATNGTPIRIWKSNTPYSTCGFYFICNVLRNIDCEISVISLPEYKQVSENETVAYYDWGQIDAGKFYQFLPLEKRLSQSEKRMFSNWWCDLVTENAPLRAVVNGKLISVPVEFYDYIIIKSIPEDDFLMARFIGEIMGKYELGVSDGWYALRIDKMIEENKLIIVENKDMSHPYKKILKKVMV
ncbi:hypothetical protein AN1V17_16130 [Vallitalea sediminicola]